MKSKLNPLLPASALAAMTFLAVWHVSSKDSFIRDGVAPRSRSHRENCTREQEKSISPTLIGKPARELSHDDLLAVYNREGAAAALAAAKSQPWPNRDDQVFFILTHLATENPEFVAAQLKTSGLNTFLRTGLVDTILKNWKDGRKALDWAENELTGELHCKAVAGALGILVKSEPEAAFGYFEKLPASKARSQTICDLFVAWGSHDPESALMKVKELTPEDAQSATEHVLRGWAKADPAAAAAWVLKTAPHDEKWIAGVFQSWISVSPDGARAWFDSLPEGDAKKTAHFLCVSSSGTVSVGVFSRRIETLDDTWATKPFSERDPTDLMHWAIQDTEGARSFVERNGTNPALKQLAPQVAAAISGKIGPSEAMDWALRLPEENEIRKFARGEVLNGWCDRDPAAAAGKLESLTPEQCGEMPIYLARTWVSQHPAAAADWVAGWKGGNQATMIEEVIDKWPDQDPQAAYQWLGTLPAGDGRDAGIKTMIRRERDSAPETLQPWIDLISDPQLREKTRRELK